MLDHPQWLFLSSLFVLCVSVEVGTYLRRRRTLKDEERQDFDRVQAACLTLLGLIIGFTFSMAISRYDLRKHYEADEANAIGTEYARAGLLPAADAVALRAQLRAYVDLRVRFYQVGYGDELRQINADTARLQAELWSAVEAPAIEQQTPVLALALSGMNDVLNSQAYTQAAWWNRIPTSAWALMIGIAVCCNVLVGYGWRRAEASVGLLSILPLVISISFLLIADIDSPRGGFIHVVPQDLVSLSGSLTE
jgi:hypothetical protein